MECLKIYVDRLKEGNSEILNATLPSSILDIQEEELSFKEPVHVSGDAYLADDHLVTNINARTTASLPCSICNEPVSILINVKDHCATEPLSEIRSAIYDLTPEVREALLLQVPQFIECNGGNCPERETMKKYLHKVAADKKSPTSEQVYFPFSNLDQK